VVAGADLPASVTYVVRYGGEALWCPGLRGKLLRTGTSLLNAGLHSSGDYLLAMTHGAR
jgi:hypothetical protein